MSLKKILSFIKFCFKTFPLIYCFLPLTKYSISYKIFWEKKVLQRAYILRAVQARKDNQQRWLGCCILGTTCRNYLSNYIGYTVDGTICLKIVTWSTPHLCHLFLVKSNCVISKENSGIISPLFPKKTENELFNNSTKRGLYFVKFMRLTRSIITYKY